MPKIYGSILNVDFKDLVNAIRLADLSGIDGFHFDISDGCFTDSLTFGPKIISDLRGLTKKPFEAHLMTVKPNKYFDELAGYVKRIYFHVEASSDPAGDIKRLTAMGVSPGIAVGPETQLDVISPFLADVESVLVLLVKPGKGGQDMRKDVLQNLELLSKVRKAKGYSFLISADGGIKHFNAKEVAAMGADILVSGTGVFGGEGPQINLRLFREALGIA